MSRAITVFLVLGSLTFGVVPGEAAEVWIETGPDPVEPSRAYEVRLRAGDAADRTGSAVPAGRVQRVWRSGREFLTVSDNGETGVRPAGPGLQLLAHESTDGRRFAKALVRVGRLTPGDPLRWSELGHRLELVPQFDPADLGPAAGPHEVQVLFDREPLFGVRVEAFVDVGGDPARARTDEIGVARIALDRPGRWILRVRHDAESGAGGTAGRYVATLSLSVPGEGAAR